jgi:hypothetical protein
MLRFFQPFFSPRLPAEVMLVFHKHPRLVRLYGKKLVVWRVRPIVLNWMFQRRASLQWAVKTPLVFFEGSIHTKRKVTVFHFISGIIDKTRIYTVDNSKVTAPSTTTIWTCSAVFWVNPQRLVRHDYLKGFIPFCSLWNITVMMCLQT